MTTAAARPLDARTDATLRSLDESGQYKRLHTPESPMDLSLIPL